MGDIRGCDSTATMKSKVYVALRKKRSPRVLQKHAVGEGGGGDRVKKGTADTPGVADDTAEAQVYLIFSKTRRKKNKRAKKKKNVKREIKMRSQNKDSNCVWLQPQRKITLRQPNKKAYQI